jgi:50S ribosomal protein L16 3-hydroxylase
MIESWLAAIADVARNAPASAVASARAAIPFLNWETIDRLLASAAKPDMLVVRNAKLLDRDVASGDDAKQLFADGWSLVLRRCERHDPALRKLADEFGAVMPGDVSIQIYATPAGFQSFGWHYDCEDVFIAQTAGVKRYFLRRNTVNPMPRLDAMPRDMQFERETSPMLETTLIPGDWLHIPRGWWHAAKATEDALSISVGVLSADAAGQSFCKQPAK